MLGPAVLIAVAPWANADARTISGAEIAQHGIVAHGTPACESCHGAAGSPPINALTARLAGLDAEYLQRQLQLFASGQRRNLAMMQVAKSLSSDSREAVATYFSSLPVGTWGRRPAIRPGDAGPGQRLAERGRWAVNVPPCASCHGVDGLGVGAISPPLASQSAAYIEAQLIDWSDGDRTGDPLGLMTGIARRLNAKDRKSVAAYYGFLPSQAARDPVSGKTPR